MAECYRKNIRKHVDLHCLISQEADEFLRRYKDAHGYGYGWAIDELVKELQRTKSCTASRNFPANSHNISAYG